MMMNNIMGMYQNFMRNPVGFLMQNRMNVPQNIMNDPNAIISYLMDNGMANQSQYNQARKMFDQYYKR